MKEYKFYGWRTADVKDRLGLTPRDYYDILSKIWCADTCAPRMRKDWTPENKTLGQCSVTAFLMQDIYGGRVYGVPLKDGNYHCFNDVSGCVFDLTSEQFGGAALDYGGCPEQLREIHFGKEEKRLRYMLLKKLLNGALAEKKTAAVTSYLKSEYDPDAIIIYGSFADGSANENSDFDALVISNDIKKHDSSVIDGTVLDVFVYPADTFASEYDPKEFIQVFDGRIAEDRHGIAESLKKRISDYINNAPEKTKDEIKQEIDWCEKMLSRTVRGDAEGFFRWHWLLTDSLEIYHDIKHIYYFGPKKAIRRMEQNDAESYRIYSRALAEFDRGRLEEWINRLKHLFDSSQTDR